MIKRTIQQEDINLVNIYAPNIGTLKCVNQILTNIKGEISSDTEIVGGFKIHKHQWIDLPEKK